MPMPIKR